MINNKPDAFVFMKVGNHAGETFEEILERKRREIEDAGRTFWGYGGSVCHPITQVQPFASQHAAEMGSIYLLMEYIDSKADPDVVPATEFSVDGVSWEPVPDGIRVTGSRYALVLDSIDPGDLELKTEDYSVGVGPSRGKGAEDYIQGRVDKACLVRNLRKATPGEIRKISYGGRLVDPYAVLLR